MKVLHLPVTRERAERIRDRLGLEAIPVNGRIEWVPAASGWYAKALDKVLREQPRLTVL